MASRRNPGQKVTINNDKADKKRKPGRPKTINYQETSVSLKMRTELYNHMIDYIYDRKKVGVHITKKDIIEMAVAEFLGVDYIEKNQEEETEQTEPKMKRQIKIIDVNMNTVEE